MRENSGLNPLLVFCIEVADPNLIDAWCKEGHLPNLDRLRRQGSWGRLRSVNDLSSGCIWPSFFTGTNPAKHGIAFHHMQLLSGTYHLDKFGPDQVKRDPFWRYLHEAGRRCAVVDVPVTCPLPGFNGAQVFGWGVEAPARHCSSQPPELMDEVLREIGQHPLADESDRRRFIRPRTRDQHAEVARLVLEGVQLKGRMLQWLLARGPWDFFLGVFGESHWADHILYQMLDPTHPDHNPEFAEEEERFFVRLYQAHDAAIGQLLASAPNANVVVLSGSGMRPTYSGNHLLPVVLQRLGFGSERSGGEEGGTSSRDWAYYRIRWLQDAIPPSLITAAKRLVPARQWDRWTRRVAFAGAGWSTSRAFALMNDFPGNIRLNLKGREPKGRVDPSEYDAVCEELATELLALKNAASGTPAVERVIKVRQEYHGEYIDCLPDLAVVWATEAPITGLSSPRVGTVTGVNPERRPGAHHPDAFVLLSGPAIAEGHTLAEAHLLDLAPTFLHLMGVPIPSDLDGRILDDALAG